MVPIDDAEVRWAVLKYLVGLIEAGHIEPLLAGGLTPEALEALRSRSVRDLSRIAKDGSIGLHLKLDSRQLSTAFVRLDAVVRDKELLEYLVRHGTPSHQLIRLFRVSSQELRNMRAILCADEKERGGRPGLPDLTVREAIHAAWAEIAAAQPDERERLVALHQRFPDYTVGTLWTALHEFGEPVNPSAPATKSRTR